MGAQTLFSTWKHYRKCSKSDYFLKAEKLSFDKEANSFFRADGKLTAIFWKQNKRKSNYFFTISRFFQRKFLPLHFLHFKAVSALRAPQSRQIFM